MNPEVLKKSGPLITYLAKDYPQSPDFVQSVRAVCVGMWMPLGVTRRPFVVCFMSPGLLG